MDAPHVPWSCRITQLPYIAWTGVLGCNDERWISSCRGVQLEPHWHPAHALTQLLQAAATFLQLLGCSIACAFLATSAVIDVIWLSGM
jgi:hypothetical protein